MTRINLVPPNTLMDQHLMAEWREIKMVPKALGRSLKRHGAHGVLTRIPPSFCLGRGHVMFFYDKGSYLKSRYRQLTDELIKRGFSIDRDAELDPDDVYGFHMYDDHPEIRESYKNLYCDSYSPTEEAMNIIRQRLAEKIAQRPGWYRYYGVVK